MSGVKPLLESALLRADPHWRARRRIRGKALILAYHNVVPDDAGDWSEPSLHLPRTTFCEQLDLLQELCEVVPVVDILAGRRSDQRPVVAITFDDAYLGAVTLGAAELEARELPATYFVAPGRLGGQSFWWDSLSCRDGRLGAKARNHILEELAGREEAADRWARGLLDQREVPPIARTATEDQVLRIAETGRVQLGSHSWSHPNLAALDDAELDVELAAPKQWLEIHTRRSVPILAFPYGLSSLMVQERARSAGYHAGLAISGGWVEAQSPNCLPRMNVPRGLSLPGFALRLRGLLAGGGSL